MAKKLLLLSSAFVLLMSIRQTAAHNWDASTKIPSPADAKPSEVPEMSHAVTGKHIR